MQDFLYFLPKIVLAAPFLQLYFRGPLAKANRNLKDLNVVITGTTSGIGAITTQYILKANANVFAICRDQSKMNSLIQEWKNQGIATQNLHIIPGELSDLESMKKAGEIIKQKVTSIDTIINNAGVMAIPTLKTSKQGYEMQMAVNYFAHAQLFQSLAPLMINNKSRVITVSSMAYVMNKFDIKDLTGLKQPYSATTMYSNSKLAGILFSEKANEIYEQKGVKLVSLHPGVVRTNLSSSYLDNPFKKAIYNFIRPIYWVFTKSAYRGAQTTLQCVFEDYEKLQGGKYYSDCKVRETKDFQIDKDEFWKQTQSLLFK